MKLRNSVSTNPADAKERLSNIRPREVSLVDEAANGRVWLIVKRRSMKTKTITKRAAGTTEAPATTTAPAAATTTEAPVTKTVEAPATEPAKTTEAPATPAAPARQIEKAFQAVVDKTLADVPVLKVLASDQKEMFLAMSNALVSMAGSMDLIRSDLMMFMLSDGKTGFGGQPMTEVAKSVEGIEDGLSDEALSVLLSIVEKKGRKMSGKRLTKFKELTAGLVELLKEVDAPTESTVTKGGNVTTKEAAPANPAATTTAAPAAAPAATDKPVEKAAGEGGDVGSIVEAAVAKALKPVTDRLEVLEKKGAAPAAPAAEPAPVTEDVTTTKSAPKKSLFAGAL